MIAWTWDAQGPDYCGHGISSDETRAVQAAEAFMTGHGATAATVETVRVTLGMEVTYERLKRRRAHNGKTGIRWRLAA